MDLRDVHAATPRIHTQIKPFAAEGLRRRPLAGPRRFQRAQNAQHIDHIVPGIGDIDRTRFRQPSFGDRQRLRLEPLVLITPAPNCLTYSSSSPGALGLKTSTTSSPGSELPSGARYSSPVSWSNANPAAPRKRAVHRRQRAFRDFRHLREIFPRRGEHIHLRAGRDEHFTRRVINRDRRDEPKRARRRARKAIPFDIPGTSRFGFAFKRQRGTRSAQPLDRPPRPHVRHGEHRTLFRRGTFTTNRTDRHTGNPRFTETFQTTKKFMRHPGLRRRRRHRSEHGQQSTERQQRAPNARTGHARTRTVARRSRRPTHRGGR